MKKSGLIKITMISALCVAMVLTGCGSATKGVMTNGVMMDSAVTGSTSRYESVVDGDMGFAPESSQVNESGSTGSATDAPEITLLEEKLVYYCDLTVETLKYDETMSSIKALIKETGGIIQSENERDYDHDWYYANNVKTGGTRENTLQVRVPSERYNEFVEGASTFGKVVNKSTSIDNISRTYYDTTSEIAALKIQEAKLLDMMAACETIEDMLTVDERLYNVQKQLSALQTKVTYMDMDVAYSYVTIRVEEVYEYTREVDTSTFFGRVGDAFGDAFDSTKDILEGWVVNIIRAVPYILFVVLPICVVAWLVFRKIRKWQKGRVQHPMPELPEGQFTGKESGE